MVLSSPPLAVATHQVHGSASNTENATIRPPMLAGPIDRQFSAFNHSGAEPQLGRLGRRRGRCRGPFQFLEFLLHLVELPLEILDLLLPGNRLLLGADRPSRDQHPQRRSRRASAARTDIMRETTVTPSPRSGQ